jgi:hypothetical protein
MLEPRNHREPQGPREPEIPVIDDPAEPGEPKIPEMPPPVPDPPEVVGSEYGSEERYYRADGWEPASWQPHASPVTRGEREARR